jgi:hypothetical protein
MPGIAASRTRAVSTVGPTSGFPCAWGVEIQGCPRRTPGTSGLAGASPHRNTRRSSAGHHKKVSEHLTHAAHHHEEAAKHHEAGRHETAAHHAHIAMGHLIHARGHAEEAVKAHVDEHGRPSAEQRRASA